MDSNTNSYPASLEVEYQDKHDRMTTFFRIICTIPIFIILTLLTSAGGEALMDNSGGEMSQNGGNGMAGGLGLMGGLFVATALMIIVRQRYPRWWFDFALELNRFSARVGAYLFLLTDQYPSTVDKQSVQMDIAYPNVEKDLNKWLPLVKWFLAIPHYLVLGLLTVAAVLVTLLAWFSILFTGRYPKELFDFVVGVGRWHLRVYVYDFLLTTDQYPPFSLK